MHCPLKTALPGLLVALAFLPLAGLPLEDPPAPAPPAPAPAAAPKEGATKDPPAPPLPVEEIGALLARAEQNLVLHSLSLDGRYLDRAVLDYRTAWERMPSDADGNLRAAAAYYLAFALARQDFPEEMRPRQERAGEALGLLDTAARQDGSFPGLWIVDGLVREQMADWKPAIENITRGLEGDPAKGLKGLDDVEGLDPLQVRQLRFFGLLARARALMDPATGREDLALKDVEAAEALAAEALKDPRTPRDNRLRRVVATHRAAALQRLDRLAEAEALLKDLVKEDPGSFVHCYNLALVLAQQFRFPEALQYYRRSAELAPADPRPHLKIAFILLKYPPAGGVPDPAGAEKEAAKVLGLTGRETDEYCALRGEAAFAREDRREAEMWYRRSLKLNPECRTSLNGLVMILGQEEERSEDRQNDLDEFRRRLSALTRARSLGKGMENEKPNLTFC